MPIFEIGNKAAEKWTEKDSIEIFNKIRESAKRSDINSLQAAILDVGLYSSGFYHLIEKYPVLESVKKDILEIIVAGVNQSALDGTFSAAPAIWRMKQCGERDESHFDHTTAGSKIEPSNPLTTDLITKLIDKL